MKPGTKVRVKRRGSFGQSTSGVVMSHDGRRCDVQLSDGEIVTVGASQVSLPEGRTERRKVTALPVLEREPPTRSGARGASLTFPQPKHEVVRDPSYLSFVAGHACCACVPGPLREGLSEAHHWGPRGTGQKTDDTRTVPLCRAHHDEWHDTGWIEAIVRRDAEVPPRRATTSRFENVIVSLFCAWHLRHQESA